MGVSPSPSRLRFSSNDRPSRRTRKSVRPAATAESLIEPWFAPRDPTALANVQHGDGAAPRRTMPQKKSPTTRRSQSSNRVSRAKESSGLIVPAPRAPRSARTKCGLDNRSHRTPEELIAQKMISLTSRSAQPKGDTDRRDVKVLLLAHPDLHRGEGPVRERLIANGAGASALRAWDVLAASTIEQPGEDDEFGA